MGKTKSRGKNGILIACLVAIVIIILLLALMVVYLLIPAYIKVLFAASGTFNEQSHIVQAVSPAFGMSGSEEMMYQLTGEMFGSDVTASFVSDKDRNQLSLLVDGKKDSGATFDLDANSLRLYVPDFSKRVLLYNYGKDDSGYLEDEIGKEDVEKAGFFLKASLLNPYDVGVAFVKAMKETSFETTSAKTFEVNGKDIKAKGYSMKVSGDFAKTFLEYLETEVDNDDFDDWFEGLYDKADDMDTTKLYFYVYRTRLAAIKLTSDKKSIEIDFKGGDYATQNMDIVFDNGASDELVLEIRSTCDDGREEFEYSLDGDEIGTIEYDADSGELELEFKDLIELAGELESSQNEVSGELDSLKLAGISLEPKNLTFSMTNDAKFTKLDGIEVLDIANADKEDWLELAGDIKDGINDTGLKWYILKYAAQNLVGKNLIKWWF